MEGEKKKRPSSHTSASNEKAKSTASHSVKEELNRLEELVETLRVEYEKFFTGIVPLAPEKLHGLVKRTIRKMWKMPFKKSESRFRLKTIEGRYNTLNTYWQRILKERENGVYSKDIFKADLREKNQAEDAFLATTQGAAERGMQQLFSTYKDAISKINQIGSKHIKYDAFKNALLKRAKELKAQNAGKKVSFKIVVSQGKVVIKAKLKDA